MDGKAKARARAGWMTYRDLSWTWWLGAGTLFSGFTAVRITLVLIRHESFWIVPIFILAYLFLSLQLLNIGRRRRLNAEIKRLEQEQARLLAALSQVLPVVAKMSSEREVG